MIVNHSSFPPLIFVSQQKALTALRFLRCKKTLAFADKCDYSDLQSASDADRRHSLYGRTSIGITDVFLFLIMAASSYYNLKHLIMPDVDFGIIRCIRPYNLTALLLTLCMPFRQFSEAVGSLILYGIFSLLLSAAYLILIPVLERGSRKWTM